MPTPSDRNYYELLEVSRTASADEIKQAYRRLARQHHPDMNPGDANAEARFKSVSEAYQVLGDPQRREQYDQFGTVSSGSTDPSAQFVNMYEMFEDFMGDLFPGFPMFGRRRGSGRDRQLEVTVTLVEAARGGEKIVEFQRVASCQQCSGRGAPQGSAVDSCPACAGRGEVRFQQGMLRLVRACGRCQGRGTLPRVPCTACQGAGLTVRTEKLAVTIPAGVEDGATRTMPGYGDAYLGTGPSGDLLLVIRIEQHSLFARVGHDLHVRVPISFPQAALGSVVEVPTLDGKVKMRVPAGTQPGHQLRLRGKGLPHGVGSGSGDQIVTIDLEVPDRLTEEQRALVAQLAASMNEDVHPQRRTFLEKLKDLFD